MFEPFISVPQSQVLMGGQDKSDSHAPIATCAATPTPGAKGTDPQGRATAQVFVQQAPGPSALGKLKLHPSAASAGAFTLKLVTATWPLLHRMVVKVTAFGLVSSGRSACRSLELPSRSKEAD